MSAPARTIRKRRTPRAVWDTTTEKAVARARSLALRFAAGRISGAEYEIELRTLIKSLHMGALAAGSGGRRNVTQSDLSRLGPLLRDEYGHLRRRVAGFEAYREYLADGGDPAKYDGARVTPAQLAGTVRGYVEAAIGTFERAKVERAPVGARGRWVPHSGESCEDCKAQNDRGEQPVTAFPLHGSLACGPHCKCEVLIAREVV